ncbi:type II toxin-antitoxin system RelE/ParE family toxin [bacterium]|nr:type II toxin-antitoxin system RelE/ParE family toxin [candidate division CSSED10-310 bacterium]
MKIQILDAAEDDLIDGYYFYEAQDKGLGMYFLDSLYSDIESLKLFAGIHSVHFKKFYRLLSRRFPFAVYYRIENNVIRIYAILDCRRDPAWLRRQLEE